MDFQYKAFISYSHRDARWAQWLLGALETYRLPDSKTRGVGRVFRDRDEAGAGDLKDEIQRAIAASEHLIVVASPQSARSRYVQAEIEHFAALNAQREQPGRVLTLIIDGEPNVTAGAKLDPRECFAPALRGGVTKPDGTPLEPLAADARNVGDGRTRALAKLVAGLMDVRYDTLVRRDLARRRRGRILAAVASVATLAIAGVVTAVIIAGNLEQERLREQEAAAQRDVRTLNAVSDAARARRLLEAGSPAAALALARKSLPLDDTIPFIPEAYDVIFRSSFAKAQSVDVDLVGYHKWIPVVLPLGDHAYFVYNDEGTATIWTPSAGVIYRRADLAWETRPSLAQNGSAVFVAGTSALQRLSLPQRTWTAIDLTPALGDLSMPNAMVAVDANTFYACHQSQLLKIAVDGQLRGDVEWRNRLPAPCAALALTPSGSVVAATGSLGIEFDAEGRTVHRYGPVGTQPLEIVHATSDAVILTHGGATFVFRNGEAEPLFFPGGMHYFALSADGHWFVYSDATNERVVINDLRSGASRDLKCVCVFAGYFGPDQFLTDAAGSIESHRLDTLESTGNVFTFASAALSYPYLETENMLMALRQSGMDSVAFLDTDPNQTLIADGARDLRTGLEMAAFAGANRIITKSLDPQGRKVTLLDTSSPGLAPSIPSPDLERISIFGEITPLADDKFGVLEPREVYLPHTLGVHDGNTGRRLYGTGVFTDPRMREGDRYIGFDAESEFSVFDTKSGTRTAFEDGAAFDLWEIETADLVSASFDGTTGKLDAFQLGDGAPSQRWSHNLDSEVLLLCIAPAAGQLYLVRRDAADSRLERRSLATGEVTDELAVPRSTVLDNLGQLEASDSDCDAASLRLRTATGRQLRWTVGGTALVAEEIAAAPPRDGAPAGLSEALLLDQIADARIGWDEAGSWLYDPSENRTAVSFSSSGARVSSSLYIPDRGAVVLGYENGRVEVWDARYPTAPMIDVAAHTSPVVSLDYDGTRKVLLSADREGSIHLWPLPEAAELIGGSAP